MSAIKFACISPHPPIIVREVGQGREDELQRTIDALEQVASEMPVHRPETVLLMGTHGPLNPGAFLLLTAAAAQGDFTRWGAPQVSFRFATDLELVDAIRQEAEQAGLPLDAANRWNDGLDWSVTVPLYYLRCGMGDAPLTPMNISFLSADKHFQFGQAVRRAVDRVGRRALIVASADLSHRLSEDGPYGFDPAGPELDRRVREAVASWDVETLLTMDEGLRERAGDDAVPSISFLMGALDGLRVRPRVLSYEGPFGVGYMVAAIDILEDERGTPYARAERAEAESVPAEPKDIVAAAGPRHPLVRLARDAVETFVREGRVLKPAPLSPGDLPRGAGCFVSLKTADGLLRGCIGSVEPLEPDLPREVVRNAIDAATTDPRFLPVTPEELSGLVYSVDVLAPPEPIQRLDELDPRRYGVIVQYGPRRGLLLPDIEGVDTVEQQVAIARSKALIAPNDPVALWRFEVKRYR
jgi:AmmeMemoRadiSam system protein A/AmmeMemoRadiSam system protein B